MTDLVYRSVMRDIKQKILNNEYEDMRLPDERSLSDYYHVSRSSMKRALGLLAQQGIVFKKRGSGTFINPLYLKNQIWVLLTLLVFLVKSKVLSY